MFCRILALSSGVSGGGKIPGCSGSLGSTGGTIGSGNGVGIGVTIGGRGVTIGGGIGGWIGGTKNTLTTFAINVPLSINPLASTNTPTDNSGGNGGTGRNGGSGGSTGIIDGGPTTSGSGNGGEGGTICTCESKRIGTPLIVNVKSATLIAAILPFKMKVADSSGGSGGGVNANTGLAANTAVIAKSKGFFIMRFLIIF
jgi:hypothetical protein